MKIEVATNYERVLKKEIDIELPTESKYYRKVDDGRFFSKGIMLFAIITKWGNTYRLICVETNKQDFNDFVPLSDCKRDYWLKEHGLRKTAFDIMNAPIYHDGWEEITLEEFEKSREELLNDYKK